jgi:hypothetical protein
VCDSQGGLKEPQGKQGSETFEKAMVSMCGLKYGSEFVEKTYVLIIVSIRGFFGEPSRSLGEHAQGIRIPGGRPGAIRIPQGRPGALAGKGGGGDPVQREVNTPEQSLAGETLIPL